MDFDIETVIVNGETFFNPKDIARLLNISDVKSSIRNYSKEQIIKVKQQDVQNKLERKLNNAGENFLTKEGVLSLIEKSRNGKQDLKLKLMEKLFPEKEVFIINDIKEINFLDLLEDSLSVFNIKGVRQYTTLNYRIDFYIPDLKIAIEFDENKHKYYTYESQELREQRIKEALNCTFIRVDDRVNHGTNLGIILKEILQNT